MRTSFASRLKHHCHLLADTLAVHHLPSSSTCKQVSNGDSSIDVDEAVNEGEGETAAALLAEAVPAEAAESWGLGDLWEDAAAPATPLTTAPGGRRRSSVAGWESEPSIFDDAGLDFELGGDTTSSYTPCAPSSGHSAL